MELCRLCHSAVEARSQKKPNFRALIKRAFDIEVDSDCPCCPGKVCERCRLDLQAYKRHYQHKKTPYNFKISLADIEHRSGCNIESEPSEPVSLQQAANDLARTHGFAAWEQNNTLIYARICKDASSPIQVQIEPDGSWIVLAMGRPVVTNPYLGILPHQLTAENVKGLFDILQLLKPCEGNPEFTNLCRERFPNSQAVFDNRDGTTVAREEITSDTSTIRHINCHVLTDHVKCNECKNYKLTLNALNHKQKQKSHTPTATTRHDCMTKEQLGSKLKDARTENKNLKRELKKLNKIIARETNKEGVDLDSMQAEEFTQILKDHDKKISETLEEDSPQLLLWKQHLENTRKKGKTGHRWHPLILKWCIGLHHKSSAAYEFIRNTGMVSLPASTTLRRYFHFTNPTPGYDADVMEQIIKQAGLEKLTEEYEFKRNVSVIFDEIKIKSGLVYKRSTGKLVGYTDTGTVNNDLLEFSRRVANDGKAGAPDIATHVLSVMVRGIFSPLHTSVAFFPTSTVHGDQLYNVIWDGVETLESVGFRVRAFIADGASTNRKFFKLHSRDRNRTAYCTGNKYSHDGREIFFICDVPHLLKTVRNNWENSGWNNKTRNLTYNKQEIKWTQLVRLYEGGNLSTNSPGFNTVYKITQDHLHLNPSLRMKVKLAAQVLSSTVADAFEFEGRTDTQSTTEFVRNIDKFFDCLNVSTRYQGIRKRKKNLEPYTSPEDERLQWLLKDFLGWLDKWEAEASSAPLPRNEQRKLCLSEQTLDGLRITVYSFVSLAKILLQLPGVKYLCSDKLNQDPQEEAFSKIRSSGGHRTNPSVDQYGDAALKILVGGACIRGSLKGNCKRQPQSSPDTILPKAQKH